MERLVFGGDRLPQRPSCSAVQLVAKEIATLFGETAKLGMYLRFVKKIGPAKARRLAAEIIADRAMNPAALFCWRIKNNRT